jgi:hypothetical protein
VRSIGSVCLDPNESCYQENVTGDTGVCKCKPGYAKRTPTEPCTEMRPVTPDPHKDDKPTTPKPEHSSNVSGNDTLHQLL